LNTLLQIGERTQSRSNDLLELDKLVGFVVNLTIMYLLPQQSQVAAADPLGRAARKEAAVLVRCWRGFACSVFNSVHLSRNRPNMNSTNEIGLLTAELKSRN
jgi:hypothetical protein